jgi:hypothetical protein
MHYLPSFATATCTRVEFCPELVRVCGIANRKREEKIKCRAKCGDRVKKQIRTERKRLDSHLVLAGHGVWRVHGYPEALGLLVGS